MENWTSKGGSYSGLLGRGCTRQERRAFGFCMLLLGTACASPEKFQGIKDTGSQGQDCVGVGQLASPVERGLGLEG